MTDVFDARKRSEIMASISGKDTKPELMLRKALHRIGYRYRIHDRSLPGKPDIVFRRFNAVVFVHGCFWHGHDCPLFRMPSSNEQYWKEKINNNRRRDAQVNSQLLEKGWRILTVWECSLKGKTRLNFDSLISAIEAWLISESNFLEIREGYDTAEM